MSSFCLWSWDEPLKKKLKECYLFGYKIIRTHLPCPGQRLIHLDNPDTRGDTYLGWGLPGLWISTLPVLTLSCLQIRASANTVLSHNTRLPNRIKEQLQAGQSLNLHWIYFISLSEIQLSGHFITYYLFLMICAWPELLYGRLWLQKLQLQPIFHNHFWQLWRSFFTPGFLFLNHLHLKISYIL